MHSEDKIRLLHILEEADEACKYVEGVLFEEFVEDGKTVRAVTRSIEIIGEAASKISFVWRIRQALFWKINTADLLALFCNR